MQIKCLKLRIKTLAPFLITNNTGDPNMVSTREYISGTIVLGALAGLYIKKENLNQAHKDNNFRKWFLSGSIKFANAYIVAYDDRGQPQCNIPIPISIQKNKADENEIYDLLCSDKVGSMVTTKRINGFGKFESGLFYEQEVRKSLNFHHERDVAKGTTKEGMIFNYESIDAGQTFEATITGEEKDLKEMCAYYGKSFFVNIGRSRSVQYGRARFNFIKAEPEDIPVNSCKPEDKYGDLERGEVILTLLSDTIIYNDHGFSTTDKNVLEKALQDKLGIDLKIKKAFLRTGEIENFVSVWKLRKPSEQCISMGSCVLVTGANDEKLKQLQKNGLGERTHEGFGRVAVGIQNKAKISRENYGEAQVSIGNRPAKANEIAIAAVKNYIRTKIEINAIDDCAKFKSFLPTKSLMAKLDVALKSRNPRAFKSYLDSLRKTAKDQLQKCHNGEENLFEFLQSKKVGIDIDLENKIRNYCMDIGNFNAKADNEFIELLYKSYFEVFFSSMRKAKKTEREG